MSANTAKVMSSNASGIELSPIASLPPLQAGEDVAAGKLRIFSGEVVDAADQMDDRTAACELRD